MKKIFEFTFNWGGLKRIAKTHLLLSLLLPGVAVAEGISEVIEVEPIVTYEGNLPGFGNLVKATSLEDLVSLFNQVYEELE